MRVRAGIAIPLVAVELLAAALPGRAEAVVALEPIGTFSAPVYVASDPSDGNRLFVVEQAGRIVRVGAGPDDPPFLDLAGAGLVTAGGERGLFSVAFPPDFPQTGRLYVFYTRAGESADLGDLQIDEYTAQGNVAPLSSRRPVLTIDHEQAGNHNGGQLQFGPDGMLYIATGDGGGGGDPLEAAQSVDSLLGKILRIDPRPDGAGNAYSVPAGNPFVGRAGRDEIWSLGLRNPWRFSFDRLTADLFVGDVGQGAWEEVDLATAPAAGRGVNFGWDCREGAHPFETTPDCPASLTDPILEYPHPPDAGAAVTGGYAVRDPALEELAGRYLYADVYSGQVRSLVPGLPLARDDRLVEVGLQAAPVSFGEDACGRVYLATQGDGLVQRFTDGSPGPCPLPDPAPDPDPVTRCAGEPATALATGGRATGTPGDDVIAATGRAERIRGLEGDDLICARAGADALRGGAGNDVLRGGAGRDTCRGGAGRDRRRSCRRTGDSTPARWGISRR